MAAARSDYSENEHSILYGETEGCCPLCTSPILFRKSGSGRLTKGYEIAHIYPPNPTPAQARALVGRSAHLEINALENIIALCPSCHRKYDKDFRLEEMDKLRKIKHAYLADARAKATIGDYKIQQEVYVTCSIFTAINWQQGSTSIELAW